MSQRTTTHPIGALWLFVGRLLRNPKSVGAICPSSSYLARKMVEQVEWKPDVRIVEFGPGTGPFTQEVQRRLPSKGRYLVIERDPVFSEMLQARFPSLDISNSCVTKLEAEPVTSTITTIQ